MKGLAVTDPSTEPTNAGRTGRRRAVIVVLGAVGVGVCAVLLALFQPWALFTSTTVDEALPTAVATSPGASAGSATPAPPSGAATGTTTSSAPVPTPISTPAGPVVVSSGAFQSYEHDTSGTASLIRVGQDYVVRLADFATSNGPDVKVWLTRAPATGAEGSRSAGYVSLGDLKGNHGSQNYVVPSGVDPAKYGTVVIWCDRFSVPFGAAALAKA